MTYKYLGLNTTILGATDASQPFVNQMHMGGIYWVGIGTDNGNGTTNSTNLATGEGPVFRSCYLNADGYPKCSMTTIPVAQITASVATGTTTGVSTLTLVTTLSGTLGRGMSFSSSSSISPFTGQPSIGSNSHPAFACYVNDANDDGTFQIIGCQNIGSNGTPITIACSGGASISGYLYGFPDGIEGSDHQLAVSANYIVVKTMTGTAGKGETISGTDGTHAIDSRTTLLDAVPGPGTYRIYVNFSFATQSMTASAAHQFNYAATVMLWDQVAPYYVGGTTDVYYDGTGSLNYAYFVRTDAHLVSRSAGHDVINITPSGLGFAVIIMSTSDSDPIRNIRVIPQKWATDYANGKHLNSDFKTLHRPFRSNRLMNWMLPAQQFKDWAHRPLPSNAFWATGGMATGMPLEVAVELSNDNNADLYFNMAGMPGDGDYYINCAQFLKDHLNPNLRLVVEFENECWNSAGGPFFFKEGPPLIAKYNLHFRSTTGVETPLDPTAAFDVTFATQAVRTAQIVQAFRQVWTGIDYKRLQVSLGLQLYLDRSENYIAAVICKPGGSGGMLWQGRIGDIVDVMNVAPYFTGLFPVAWTDPSFPGNSVGSIAGGLNKYFQQVSGDGLAIPSGSGANTMTGTPSAWVLTTDAGAGGGSLTEPIAEGTMIRGVLPVELEGLVPTFAVLTGSIGSNGVLTVTSIASGGPLAPGQYLEFDPSVVLGWWPFGLYIKSQLTGTTGGTGTYQTSVNQAIGTTTFNAVNPITLKADASDPHPVNFPFARPHNFPWWLNADFGGEWWPANKPGQSYVFCYTTGTKNVPTSGGHCQGAWEYFGGGSVMTGRNWVNDALQDVTAYPTLISDIASKFGKRCIIYEMGESVVVNGYIPYMSDVGSYVSLISAASHDARMGSAYTDYISQLCDTTGLGYQVNHFANVGADGVYGDWGLVPFPATPTSTKYDACKNLIGNFANFQRKRMILGAAPPPPVTGSTVITTQFLVGS